MRGARSLTGTVRPASPSASSVASSGGSSSSVPCSHPSTTVPGRSSRRTDDPNSRNSAGSPTTSPNSAPGSSTSVPSSMPKGARQSAFTGAAIPGTADPDAAPAAREPVDRGALRDCQVGVRGGEDAHAARPTPRRQHLDQALAEACRVHHAAIEEHGAHARRRHLAMPR